GRERLLESYAVVRRTLDEVHEELQRADTEARAAADEAGRRAEADEPGDGGEPHGASPTSPPGEGAVTPAAAPSTPAVPEPGAGPDEASPAGATSEGGAAGDPGSAGQAGPVTAASADVERVRVLRGDNGAAALRARGDVGRPPALRAVEGGRVAAGGGSAVRILAPEVPQVHEAPHPPDTAAEPGVAAEPDAPGRAEAVRSDADEAALQARDRLVADAEASLVKRLKRLLQDEQNELLDRLRNAGGAPTAAAVLPDEAEQRAALVAAVAPTLTDTAGDGALAIHGGDVGADVASPVAEGLAAAVLDPLRRRLGEAVRSAAGEEQAVLVEAIGSVYREWKTQRVEPAVLDAVVAAFAAGAYAAVPAGTPLRWVVEDTAGPCPDCDDNALAGALGRGEEWPTGQLHPPAHAGCRCLLVRAEQP
ncbi:MAG TPA: hypothetical protein VFP61_13560, partial [Acidimicrobiales bacterium]|nr:hypothetical protein [Acidimicrobiales bacterium]